jgi:hypothetical protein
MDSTFSPDDLARGDEQLAQLEKQLSKLGRDAAHNPSPLQKRTNPIRFASLGIPLSLGGWTLRGFTGLLLVACIGVAAVAWRRSSDNDAAKAAPPQPASLAQTAPEYAAPGATAVSPELTQPLRPMARELATLGQEIERLEARQEQIGRDNANVAGQLKVSQEQMAHDIANVIGQLKANQEQMARDIANVAGQLKASQEQMARDIAKVSEQILASKTSAPPPRQTATPTPKPAPTQPSPQAAAQPQAKKPQVSTAPQRSTPVH